MGESFESISDNVCPSEQAKMLEKLLISKLDEYCPTKSFKLSSQDQPFINFDLKQLHRRKQREYVKNGKTKKYDGSQPNLRLNFVQQLKNT